MSDLALPYVAPPITNPDLEFRKYTNFLKSLQNRKQRSTHVSANPIDLTIDLTSACQLKCPYCSTGNGTISRVKSVMKDNLYHKLLNNVGPDCFLIWYFSNGEPLLHKRFGELVGTTKHHEVFSVISTNLSLDLSDSYLHQLITSGLGIISASIDGATEETYKQYRRGGDFNLVMKNLRRLVELKREMGLTYPLIEWRFLRFAHNEHEEEAARALAADVGVDLLEFWGGITPPIGDIDADGVFGTQKHLRGSIVSGPGLDMLAARQSQSRILARLIPAIEVGGHGDQATFTAKCDWLYFSGMLHPTGRVGPCCVSNDEEDDFVEDFDQFDTYEELFNNAKYKASREMFTSGKPSGTICQRCPNPSAQHYQFRMKLRAILRNAPEWAVGLLASDPASYFLPEDAVLVPEVKAIFDHASDLAKLINPAIITQMRQEDKNLSAVS